ncbi:hypothetical protein KEM56_000936 [Ascosphaera pollenicola]|nr:hypothetical protein KEM56_000936 [Ascosphaera pollenicola]
MAVKIIVVGSVNSSIRDVFTKLAKLQAKQGFAFAIVLGDLFGDCTTEQQLDETVALINGNISVPLPTYFTVGKHDLPLRVVEKLEKDNEVCPNLFYLGRRGSLKTSEGVAIAALGGSYQADIGPEKPSIYSAKYTQADARAITNSADILITSQWPKNIQRNSQVEVPADSSAPVGEQCVADLCSFLRPRYHFTSEAAFFYEREPFFHLPLEDSPNVKHITRFINLAPYGNTSKQKWLYAFSLDVEAPLPTTVPVGTTGTPLTVTAPKRPLDSQQESYSRFSRSSGRPPKRSRRAPSGPGECFFCLSNPNVETHLITSIGAESYVTVAKGPLPTAATFPNLAFPGHMLIIPFSHCPTFEAIGDDDVRKTTIAEMNRYRHALHKMANERSEGKLGSVTWEISRWNGIHVHWQFMPVPLSLIEDGLVDSAFKVDGEISQYPNFEKRDGEDLSIEKGDYFRVIITSTQSDSDGTAQEWKHTTLTLLLTSEFRFDLQFGRRVMAKLLQLEARSNWKDNPQTKEEETQDAETFRKAFEKYDFSLQEA